MTKSIWAGLAALVLVLACGILEVVCLGNEYAVLRTECAEVIELTKNESLSAERYAEFAYHWVELREKSELLLPHVDVYELNLRFSEGRAYAESEDFESLSAQLAVIYDLLEYIPHLMVPNFRHIV